MKDRSSEPRRPGTLGKGLDSLFGEGAGGPEPGAPSDTSRRRESVGKGIISLPVPAAAVFALLLVILGAGAHRLLSAVPVGGGPPSARAASPAAPPPSVPPGGPPGPPGFPVGPPPVPAPGSGSSDGLHSLSSAGAPPPPEAVHNRAVQTVIHRHFPLSSADIGLLKGALKREQEALHGPVPEGRAVSVQVSLDPGALFPVIHLVPGIATTITVVDATGAPWPLDDVIVGNAKAFPVRRMNTPNGLVVEPKNNVGWTSLSLVLRGRGTPAVLKLVDSDTLSDTRVTARIEGRGPNAAVPVFQEPRPVVSSRILAYLDGIPPASARSVPVRGTADMEAWREGNRLFVRTHMDILAPAWTETVSGPNGMKLFVFPPVSVITAAGEDGNMVTVELGEESGHGQKG